jgi:hypothetical protein
MRKIRRRNSLHVLSLSLSLRGSLHKFPKSAMLVDDGVIQEKNLKTPSSSELIDLTRLFN